MSVHTGGSASVHAGIPPPPSRHPPRSRPPWSTPREQTPPRRRPPGSRPPPGETATAADGTHPTGMHSCLLLFIVTYTASRSFLFSIRKSYLSVMQKKKLAEHKSAKKSSNAYQWREGRGEGGGLNYYFLTSDLITSKLAPTPSSASGN